MNCKNLKFYFILTMLLLAQVMSLNAQENIDRGLYLGAHIGIRHLRLPDQFAIPIDQNFSAFSIGAGSSWIQNRVLIGLEFASASHEKSTMGFRQQYVGFSNTILLGYNLSNIPQLKIFPTIGLSMDNDQLILQSNDASVFQNIKSQNFRLQFGLDVRLKDSNNMFSGLKLGYHLPLRSSDTWEDTVPTRPDATTDAAQTFYLLFQLGGFLSFEKDTP